MTSFTAWDGRAGETLPFGGGRDRCVLPEVAEGCRGELERAAGWKVEISWKASALRVVEVGTAEAREAMIRMAAAVGGLSGGRGASHISLHIEGWRAEGRRVRGVSLAMEARAREGWGERRQNTAGREGTEERWETGPGRTEVWREFGELGARVRAQGGAMNVEFRRQSGLRVTVAWLEEQREERNEVQMETELRSQRSGALERRPEGGSGLVLPGSRSAMESATQQRQMNVLRGAAGWIAC